MGASNAYLLESTWHFADREGKWVELGPPCMTSVLAYSTGRYLLAILDPAAKHTPAECRRPCADRHNSWPQWVNQNAGVPAQVYSVQVGSWKWTEHTSEVEGDAPQPRSGHTAVALPDGRHLALFGGGDADKDLFYSSVSVLDTATWRWSTPKIQVIHPCPVTPPTFAVLWLLPCFLQRCSAVLKEIPQSRRAFWQAGHRLF